MSKNRKSIIITLIIGALVLFALFFIIGDKKTYTISFNSEGGSDVASQKVKEGDRVTIPTNPVKEDYTFVRWEYQNEEYDFNKTVSSDMTLKAIWEEVQKEIKYDVTFTINDKEKTISVDKITEEDLEGLGFEEKSGYVIKWYVDGKEYDLNTPLTDNIKLTGKYEKTTLYTVKFNSDGGSSVKSQQVKPKEKVKEPDSITKYGFIFDGWYLNNKKYDFDTAVTKSITLVAKWSEDPEIPRYEVTFDSDGGTAVDKKRVIENQKASEPKSPTKSGYTFLGWYLNDSKYDFKTEVTKDITLKAKWEKIVEYTVTFDSNGGSSVPSQTVQKDKKATVPNNPTKEGYTFVEWQLDGKAYNFDTKVTKDITLVASYNKIIKYTVTFDSNGGSAVPSQTVEENKKATAPNNPTKANNDFVEWQLDGVKYDFNTAVTKDIKLVAKWKEKTVNDTYTITASKADNMAATDSILKVYKNGQEISFKEIQYTDGTKLCDGSKPVVMTSDLAGVTTFNVILNNGTSVKATLK